MRPITITQLIKRDLTKLAIQLKLSNRDAKYELQLLLQHALGVDLVWLIAHENDVLDLTVRQGSSYVAYVAMLQRRLNGEPIAYILGYREFYGLNFKVSADTLIPRADTETLVETALAKVNLILDPSPPFFPSPLAPFPPAGEANQAANLSSSPTSGSGIGERGDITILDLGTGTGAIALAFAKNAPQAHVTALDASQAALDIAIENAQNLNITNVKFIFSDWFGALDSEKFDIIVSNPPYIEVADTHLNQGDLRFEPISALASGADGLDDIREIITLAPLHLKPHGWLMLEHGYNQANKVAELLKQVGFVEIRHVKDLADINRVTIGQLINTA